MNDELEKQMQRIELSVAGILDAVKNLHDAPSAASEINSGEINPSEINPSEINPSEINLRLQRFLEKKK
jgi:hypothetical protein